jgi:phage terminase large subunit-like protein
VVLDPWQEAVLQAAMGERSDGTWAAKQIGLSAPRQNGKSQLIVARALAGALLFGEKKIVISAHAQDTARETFAKFLEQIDESPALAERIDKVMNALNREFIKFKNGAVVQFKARTVSGSAASPRTACSSTRRRSWGCRRGCRSTRRCRRGRTRRSG